MLARLGGVKSFKGESQVMPYSWTFASSEKDGAVLPVGKGG